MEWVRGQIERMRGEIERVRLDVNVIVCDCGEKYKDSDLVKDIKFNKVKKIQEVFEILF
jgi:hypothetical protein